MFYPGIVGTCQQSASGPTYTSNASIQGLSFDSVGTINFGGGFDNPCAIAVAPDSVVVGLADPISVGPSSANIVSYALDATGSFSGTTAPLAGVNSSQSKIRGICWGKDGEHLYAAGQSNSNRVERFDLSTAYDITTASSAQTAALGSAMDALQGIAISGDGTKFYATRSTSGAVGETIEYTMSTPFDLSTLSADRTVTAASTGNFSGGFVMDIFVSPDKSKLVIMSLGGDASNGYQTILDEWPLTAGNITPISGSTDRKTKNVSNSLGDTYDASGDDSNVYSQGANFHPNGEVLVVVGVLMDDSPTNSSNQCHITRWTT